MLLINIAMLIRTENEKDRAEVYALNSVAFASTTEADLVNALRKEAQPVISLVAEENGQIVGHIMFSPVTLTGHEELKIMGLAPMAVAPEQQNRGYGSALVRAGLEQCRQLGAGAVVVLGHATYYPRFGFSPSSNAGISCEYDVPEEYFMVLELQPGYLQGKSGTIKYHNLFSDV